MSSNSYLSWSTLNEKRVLDFMVFGEREVSITTQEKITRLEGWLNTFKARRQLKSVDYLECETHARKLLKAMQIKMGYKNEFGEVYLDCG